MWRNGELLQSSIGFMMLQLGSHAGSTRLDVSLHEPAESWSIKFPAGYCDSLGLTKMARKKVIMFELEDLSAEICRVRDVNKTIK